MNIKQARGKALDLLCLNWAIKRRWYEIPYLFDWLLRKRATKLLRCDFKGGGKSVFK